MKLLVKSSLPDYGGAFDLDPHSIFTREDLDEFGSDVEDMLKAAGCDDVSVRMYMSDNYKHIEVDAYDADGSTYFTSITPDMRKIKRIPQDLTTKYSKVIVDDIAQQYRDYHKPF